MTTHTTHPQPTATLGRRSVVRTAAWSVPVVTVASTAPAYATSGTVTAPVTYGLVASSPGNGQAPEVTRCVPTIAGTLVFAATIDNTPAPVGETVTVSLPAGLVFAAGGREATVRITQAGVVQVPAFTATGAAGTYTVTAAYRGTLATQSIEVVPAPGSVVELRRSTGTTSTTASFSTLAVGVTNAVAGSIQGDQTASSAGANGAVLTSAGTVRTWGANVGTAAGAPGTLQYGGGNLGGITTIDAWTSTGGGTGALAQATGGVAAGTTGADVYQCYRSGTGTGVPTVLKVTGISGPVLAVSAEDGYSHVLTNTGVHRWANATSSAAPSASIITGTAGATVMSAWSHRRPSDTTLRAGGAAVNGRSVTVWSGTSTLSLVTANLPAGVGTVSKVVATDSGIMVLGTNGTLWSYGAGFAASGSAVTTWTQRASGVADFTMWGYNSYVGGLYLSTTGAVTQFFGFRNWYTPVTVRTGNITNGTALTGITKVFSSDGTYLALRSDGTVYAWGGNLDNPGRGAAVTIGTDAGTTVDLNVWGGHWNDVYYGGGYVIKAAAGC